MNGQYEKLKNIKESKISNVTKYESTTTNLAKVSKWLNVAGKVYSIAEVRSKEYKNYVENGTELDDVVVDAGISWAGIVGSAVAGSATGEFVGSLIGSAVGPVGTGIGIIAGFTGGALFGGIYGVIKPVLIDEYNDIVEPVGEWSVDKVNNIGDWWDSLLW